MVLMGFSIYFPPNPINNHPKPSKLGPETPLDRRVSPCSAGCTQSLPRRPILRPSRGTQSIQIHFASQSVGTFLLRPFFQTNPVDLEGSKGQACRNTCRKWSLPGPPGLRTPPCRPLRSRALTANASVRCTR
jgi:hypothetical protein